MFSRKENLLNSLSHYGSEFDEIGSKHAIMQTQGEDVSLTPDAATAAAEAEAAAQRRWNEQNEMANGLSDAFKEIIELIESFLGGFGFDPNAMQDLRDHEAAVRKGLNDPGITQKIKDSFDLDSQDFSDEVMSDVLEAESFDDLLDKAVEKWSKAKITDDIYVTINEGTDDEQRININGSWVDVVALAGGEAEFRKKVEEELAQRDPPVTRESFNAVQITAVEERAAALASDRNHSHNMNNLADFLNAAEHPDSNPFIAELQAKGLGNAVAQAQRLGQEMKGLGYDLSEVPLNQDIINAYDAYKKDPVNGLDGKLVAQGRIAKAYARDNNAVALDIVLDVQLTSDQERAMKDFMQGKDLAPAAIDGAFPNAVTPGSKYNSLVLEDAQNAKYDQLISMKDVMESAYDVQEILGSKKSNGRSISTRDAEAQIAALNDPIATSIYENAKAHTRRGSNEEIRAMININRDKTYAHANSNGIDLNNVILDKETTRRMIDGKLGDNLSARDISKYDSETRNEERMKTNRGNRTRGKLMGEVGDLVGDIFDGVGNRAQRKMGEVLANKEPSIMDGAMEQVPTMINRAGKVAETYISNGAIKESVSDRIKRAHGNPNFQEDAFGIKVKNMQENRSQREAQRGARLEEKSQARDAARNQSDVDVANEAEAEVVSNFRVQLIEDGLAKMEDGKLVPVEYVVEGDDGLTAAVNGRVATAVNALNELSDSFYNDNVNQTKGDGITDEIAAKADAVRVARANAIVSIEDNEAKKFVEATVQQENLSIEVSDADLAAARSRIAQEDIAMGKESEEAGQLSALDETLTNANILDENGDVIDVNKEDVSSRLSRKEKIAVNKELDEFQSAYDAVQSFAENNGGNQFSADDPRKKEMNKLLEEMKKELTDVSDALKGAGVELTKGIGYDNIVTATDNLKTKGKVNTK